MIPTPAQRNVLFKAFSKALSARDMEALYGVVTPDFRWSYHDGISVTKLLAGAGPIIEHLAGQKALFSSQRFHEIAYHHLPEMTFMTMRVSETVRATGAQREQRGVECYTFKDSKIATKDVYRKPIEI
mgnify:FL=1